MKRIKLDFRYALLRYELQLEIKDKFKAPDYYGMNLDALNDILGEINEPTLITIKGAGRCEEFFGDYGKTLLSILRMSSENCRKIVIRELP